MTLFDYLDANPAMGLVYLVVLAWALRPLPRVFLFRRPRQD